MGRRLQQPSLTTPSGAGPAAPSRTRQADEVARPGKTAVRPARRRPRTAPCLAARWPLLWLGRGRDARERAPVHLRPTRVTLAGPELRRRPLAGCDHWPRRRCVLGRAGKTLAQPLRGEVQIQLAAQAVHLAERATGPQAGRAHTSVNDLHDGASLPSRTADALTMVRRARAMRPCLPITLPTSSFATAEFEHDRWCRSSVAPPRGTVVWAGLRADFHRVPPSRSFQHPTTPSSSSARKHLLLLLSMPLIREQPLHHARRLNALRQPLLRAFSASISISDGFMRGLYWPMVSMARPSRRARASTTTMR